MVKYGYLNKNHKIFFEKDNNMSNGVGKNETKIKRKSKKKKKKIKNKSNPLKKSKKGIN